MKKRLRLLFLLISIPALTLFAQRNITEATFRYQIVLQPVLDSTVSKPAQPGVLYTCFLKGPTSRTDLETSLGKQSTIIHGKTGSVTLLKEYGPQHYLIQLNSMQWELVNEKFEDSRLELLSDTTFILGYLCRKAQVTLKDGTVYSVWYTPLLLPTYREFQQIGKTLPGLLMEYHTVSGGVSIHYRITHINFSPVPQAVFDIPTTGYRILSYEESRAFEGGQ